MHLRSWLLSRYPHLLRVSLERPTPVLRRLRHFHTVHLVSDPGGSSSLGLSAIAFSGGRLESLSSHLEILVPLEDDDRRLTLFRKLLLDLRRLVAGTWLKRGCRSSSTCRWRSLILVTCRLTSGGAMPARIYMLSVVVGRRHPVIRRQLALRAGSTFFACVDLSHTGHAYSAEE